MFFVRILFPEISLVVAFSFRLVDHSRVSLIFFLLSFGLSCASDGTENRTISKPINHFAMDEWDWVLWCEYLSKFLVKETGQDNEKSDVEGS